MCCSLFLSSCLSLHSFPLGVHTTGLPFMPQNYLNISLDFLALPCSGEDEQTVRIILSACFLSPISTLKTSLQQKEGLNEL